MADDNKPLWQMTSSEFMELLKEGLNRTKQTEQVSPIANFHNKYVYGIVGIANLFGCSIPTANRIKKSGKIDQAITQIGCKIIVDAELALELAGRKTGGRR